MKILMLGLALCVAPAVHAASYLISVNTTTINSTAGILIFDFPTLNAQASYAAISGFTGAPLGSPLFPLGTISGGLPTNDLILTAAAPPSGANYGIYATFDTNAFSFLLNLYGPAVDSPDSGPDGTTFSITLADSSFTALITAMASWAHLISPVTAQFRPTASALQPSTKPSPSHQPS